MPGLNTSFGFWGVIGRGVEAALRDDVDDGKAGCDLGGMEKKPCNGSEQRERKGKYLKTQLKLVSPFTSSL